jgi:integrase
VVVSCIGRGFDLEDADHITGANGCFAGPWNLDRDIRKARELIGLADGFRFHDLRHFYASLLIASGADVKVVQYRLRHASAKTTLDTYSHLWPDSDESTRTAVEQVLSQRLVESSLNRQASR